jgi:hypothetical protein
MNKVRDLVDLSAIYEAVKAPKLTDPKAKHGTKPGKPLKSLPEVKAKTTDSEKVKEPFFHKDSGPANADGFKSPVDPKTNKGKENHYEPEKFSNTDEKSVKENINNWNNREGNNVLVPLYTYFEDYEDNVLLQSFIWVLCGLNDWLDKDTISIEDVTTSCQILFYKHSKFLKKITPYIIKYDMTDDSQFTKCKCNVKCCG